MRILASGYDKKAQAHCVSIDGRTVVVVNANHYPRTGKDVKEISVQIEKTIWVAYPSRVGSQAHLVILIANAETGVRVAPVLVSEPLTRRVAADYLQEAANAEDPINELQASVHFLAEEGN